MATREQLFDLAVARALGYAKKLHLDLQSESLQQDLELWYLKTRFAYRIPLADIVTTLQTYPSINHQWKGGKNGTWVFQEARS